MTSDRGDEFNGRTKEADVLGDNDDLNREGKRPDATSMVRAVVDQDRWTYYHKSTP